MPGYIIYDTEGSGLFRHKNADGTVARSDEPGQPRMAEFACVLLDDDFNIESEFQQFIYPEGWLDADGLPLIEMPEQALEVNKLTFEKLRAEGKPVKLALDVYVAAVLSGRSVIGFNQQHDGRQIRAELRHAGLDDMFETTLNSCAMRSISTNMKGQVKKLNGKGGFVRLIDAAAHMGIEYDEEKRHTALEDAQVTAKVAKWLHERGYLLEPAVHRAKGMEDAS